MHTTGTRIGVGLALLLASGTAIGMAAPATAAPVQVSAVVSAAPATSAPTPVQGLATWYTPGTSNLSITFAAPRVAADSYTVSLVNVTTGVTQNTWTLTAPPTVEDPLTTTPANPSQKYVVKVTAVNSAGSSTESKAMVTAGAIEPVNMVRTSLAKDTVNGGYLTVASWNAPNFSAQGRITTYNLYDSNHKLMRTVDDTTVTLNRSQSDRANPAPYIAPVSDAGTVGTMYRLGVTIPKDGYLVKLTNAPHVATQGDTITVDGKSSGYNPGNWVNAWVQQADGQWVDAGGVITEDSTFNVPVELKTSGAQNLQLSIGSYPENRWSNIVPVAVTPAPAPVDTAVTVTSKNDGAGHTYMVVTGHTTKVKPGGVVYLWTAKPGASASDYVMWTVVTGADGEFTFDHVNGGTVLSQHGDYTVTVTPDASLNAPLATATYTH